PAVRDAAREAGEEAKREEQKREGAADPAKATKDTVEKLKRKTKSDDAGERGDAEKQLDDIAKKAEDPAVRDAAREAGEAAQREEQRRQAEADPGDAKGGGQRDPNGQEQKKEAPVAQGKDNDGKDGKEVGDSKGDQPGAPGKDKAVSKGQGDKTAFDLVKQL